MVNYAYDMRGWKKEISTSDGFVETLQYQDGATPCYNGNISTMTWKNSNVKEMIQSLAYIRGDVNGDGSISMADVNMVIDYYLAADKPDDFNFAAADVNGDGYITMSDANQMVNMYLSGGSITDYQVYTEELSIKDNQNLLRKYDYSYDGANRLTSANYGEERADGTTVATTPNYNEWCEYDQNSNITKMYRNGKMQNGKYGCVDNLVLNYKDKGNQLTSVTDKAAAVTNDGSTDYKGTTGVEKFCTYNGVGALTSDVGRNIALIEYDNMNNPSRIQFTNGNVTKYVYSATGEKLRTIYQTAVPNITVAVGTAHELTASELLYTDSVDYYHGGKLTVKNGKIDKYYFDGGYAQAEPIAESNNDAFAFYYYTADHLGNIREVIDEKGDVVQITNFYPFGTPYSAEDCATLNPDKQDRKYNGKEFDTMHGLNTYDYGARQYNALLGRWDRVDPLAEKYYSVSPYAYCLNDPIRMVDNDGREPGQFFYTKDAAAMDFGKFYNDNSIRTNREYASYIFKVKDAQGHFGYTYSIANIGTSDGSLPVKEYGSAEYVATAHTHGSYTSRLKEGNDTFSGVFDENGNAVTDRKSVRTLGTDIGNANARQLDSYVATPNGSLQKYDPKTGKVTVISNQMASDLNDPDRMNLIEPIEQDPITLKRTLNMQNNIDELIRNTWIKR